MKHFILLILAFLNLSRIHAQQEISLNVTFHSNWDDDNLPGHFYGTYNDVWGYVDSNGREYAILGSASYIHFFDVTDPDNPVLIDQVLGGSQTVWRDFSTYQNRAYAASDASSEGIHIFDLSNLPDTIIKTNQVTEFFTSAHNIFIDEANGRLYAAGINIGADLVVLDIATNPDEPILLGSVSLPNAGYVHDVYVRDNIAYASHGNANKLVIWDFNDPANPEYIASFESNGYNHSSWLTDDGNTLVFADEVPTGLPVGILDISDMANDNLELYTYFKFPLLAPVDEGSTPHNPYILGDYVYVSYYEDGVQIFDISDPSNPGVAGFYDTYPSNTNYNGYAGCWAAYPFLPSGNFLASDMANGLFVLEFEESVSTHQLQEDIGSFKVSPNPTSGLLKIELTSEKQISTKLSLVSLTGQLVREVAIDFNGNYNEWLNISDLPSGMYFLSVGDMPGGIKKIIKN